MARSKKTVDGRPSKGLIEHSDTMAVIEEIGLLQDAFSAFEQSSSKRLASIEKSLAAIDASLRKIAARDPKLSPSTPTKRSRRSS